MDQDSDNWQDKNKVDIVFSALDKQYPNSKTELLYSTDYNLLIAIVLSAQCTDKRVNQVTEKLFSLVTIPEEMLKLGYDKLKEIIFPLGLSSKKASSILELTKIIVHAYDSEIPKTIEQLILLPGVGRKTANVFLNCLTQSDTIGVDTHVKRLAGRLGFIKSNNELKIEKKLMQIVPKKWLAKAHNLMVLHGRYVCVASKPHCSKCVLSENCHYFLEQLKESLS